MQSLKDRFANPRFNYALLRILAEFLGRQRWFMSKGKEINECRIADTFQVTEDSLLAIVHVNFADGSTEIYQLPLAQLADPRDQARYLKETPNQILLKVPGGPTIVDAVPLPAFRKAIYAMIRDGADTWDGLNCECGKILRTAPADAPSVLPNVDTSNTAIIYADKYFFKLFRKLDPGLNPDLELVRFLSEKSSFTYCPPYGGSLGVGKMTAENYLNLGMLSGKVDNRGDAWEYFQELTERYFKNGGPVDEETLGRVRLLGQRTAEMHLALGAGAGAMMVKEAMSEEYRQEITAAATKMLDRQVQELTAKRSGLSPDLEELATKILDLAPELRQRLSALEGHSMEVDLIRIHADYHLGQVLVSEDDFYIIDFEGEPLLSIPERRRKRPALKDVAGMVRSFHYAARGQLLLNESYSENERAALVPRAEAWFTTVSAAYLESYYLFCGDASFLPASTT
ncbi:MAG: phosphotransferase, partial [Bacteroidota bacterium]